ncbi:MAG: 3-deoxy-7-phosphoheptulonate synthase [bacterium]|nr:3-deoxy-7-phosphoheptulonate synthase [bacterium]
MNYRIIKPIPTPEEIAKEFPLSTSAKNKIQRDREEVKNILSGKDPRKLIIIGPCAAWPQEAVLEYAKRLKPIADELDDRIKIIMRVYIQKPRTTKGWTGPINRPDPLADPDIANGIRYCRKMMVEVIELGLPIADEALFTHNAGGFIELLSWVAIGARSVEDQEHRIFASAIDCPVGMKNTTAGSIEIGVNSIVSAQNSHTVVLDRHHVMTEGNHYAHLVLRGGKNGPNYSPDHVREAKTYLEKQNIKNPAIIIDCSHDNCIIDGKKLPHTQANIGKEIFAYLEKNSDIKHLIKGLMLESFIKEGNQKIDSDSEIDRGGLSIVDPCLGWDQSKQLLYDLVKLI